MPHQATVYFTTGTGNSFRLATWLAQAAAAAGFETSVRTMEGQPDPVPVAGPGDWLALVYPTHGFIAPWHAMRFAARLPRTAGTRAVVVGARGSFMLGRVQVPGLEGVGAYLLGLILRLRGYRFVGAMGVDVPVSWLALHPGMGPAAAGLILGRARAKVSRFMERVLGGRTAFWGLVCVLLGLVLLPVTLLYLLIGRFMLAKFFFATDRCTGCGVCAESCPVGAIRMVGRRRPRPYWTFHCETCQRCIAYCPQRAIEASHSLALGLWLLTTSPAVAYLMDRVHSLVGLGPGSAWWLLSMADWLAWLIWLSLIYPVFWLLIRVPAINALFAYTTLTRWYRRYRASGCSLAHIAPGSITRADPLAAGPSVATTSRPGEEYDQVTLPPDPSGLPHQ